MNKTNTTNVHKIMCAENDKSFIFTREEIISLLYDITSDAYVAGFKTGYDIGYEQGYTSATCDIACDIFKASVLTGAIE